MILREVNPISMGDIQILYKLLGERTAQQSISHKGLPTFREHIDFVKSRPYAAWYIIVEDDDNVIGSTYLTHNNELGIFIFKEHNGKGYGKRALEEVMDMHEPPFYANINPLNEASKKLFEEIGFKYIQMTYVLGVDNAK